MMNFLFNIDCEKSDPELHQSGLLDSDPHPQYCSTPIPPHSVLPSPSNTPAPSSPGEECVDLYDLQVVELDPVGFSCWMVVFDRKHEFLIKL
jgi:hypothetical protein